MASTDARPIPQKNVAYRVTFPILDNDGDLVVGAAGLDSEISKDGGTFADCTNEATQIATNSGVYFLDLTSTEMNADTVAIIVKTSTTDAKTTTIVLYPEESGDIRVNVTAYGGTAGTFASGRPEVNTSHIAGSAVSTSSAQIGVNVINAAGTAWNSGAIGPNTLASDTIAAAKIATGAITNAKFAAGAIDAAAIAADAIGASELAADAASEIGTAVWATTTRLLTAGTNIALAKGTGVTGFNDLSAAQVNAEVDTALADYDGPTHAELVSEINDVQGDIAALNDLSAAEVNAEVDAAIETYHLDHLLAATYDPASKPGASDALLNELVESDGGVSRFTANALEQAPGGGGGITADDVWDEVIEGGYSARELMRLYAAALGGKASGLGTSTAVYRNTDDDVDVITATVDTDGNRSAVTLDLTDTP